MIIRNHNTNNIESVRTGIRRSSETSMGLFTYSEPERNLVYIGANAYELNDLKNVIAQAEAHLQTRREVVELFIGSPDITEH